MKNRFTQIVLFLFLTCTLLTASGCGTKTIAVKEQIKYGNPSAKHVKDLPQVKYKESEPDRTKTKSVKSADEYEMSGDAFLIQKNYAMAFLQYEKSLEKNNDNIRVEYKKGLIWLGAKKPEDARKQFQYVLSKQENYPLAYEGLGRAYQISRNFELAKLNFQKAVSLDPLLWNSYNRLGNIYDLEKKYKAAIKEYKTAIVIKPGLGFLYNNLGHSLYLDEQYEQAVKAYFKALELNYAASKVYNNLGMVFMKTRQYDQAFEMFLKGGTEASAYNNLGIGYMQNGDMKKAIEYFTKAIEVSPKFYTEANENLKKCRILQKK